MDISKIFSEILSNSKYTKVPSLLLLFITVHQMKSQFCPCYFCFLQSAIDRCIFEKGKKKKLERSVVEKKND
ncbi:hypothetical protein RchiOBHm_Chr5g0050901 [Rosa chinensis]|uniref:Uncharacterized protein n=1 Tax=Rosa chinensis TaxID=74649 RepID=A0A2P6QF85_ROSCH|nr:hypothetical protein RchiOBHm_Chr5g0050901 [Rosa chinensis]